MGEIISELPSDYAIEAQNLVKKYSPEITAVNNVDLNVRTGELFGFLGPNGAGKTTTINILCGLLPPTAFSRLKVGKFDVITEIQKIKKIIGVCPQEPVLFDYMSARQNMQFFGDLFNVPSVTLKTRIQHLLTALALEEEGHRKIKQYSGGMKRRVNFAVALINDPAILFLDEPTQALDPQARLTVWSMIEDLKKHGKSILLTTHYIEEADRLCDRVAIIDHGQIIAIGTPRDLKTKYNVKTLEDVFIHLTGRQIRTE